MPLIITILLHLTLSPLLAASPPAGDCIPCHREKTPHAVRLWEESAHGRRGIGCEVCHGTDHEKIIGKEKRVTPAACAPCHRKAYDEHLASRHGMGLHSGWGCTRNLTGTDRTECSFCHDESSAAPKSTVSCARFMKQSKEMRTIGCNGCHIVETSCASCHTSHLTDLAIVRDPASCAKCHMGPDHPQWEMWQTSLHGTLYGVKGESVAPTCQRCHMPSGSHDVSRGITVTSGGVQLPGEIARNERERMLDICTGCHGRNLSMKALESADRIREQSLAIVKEAEEIVWDLYDRGVLDPMPENRPSHPLRGNRLVTDSQILYEDISHIERLLFTMKKFDFAKTIKGGYHQNPSYTHWYGNAELKMKLVDIRSEASRLIRLNGVKGSPPTPEGELELLKKRRERGVIGDREYERLKGEILERLKR